MARAREQSMRLVNTDAYSRLIVELVDAKVEEKTVALERRLRAALHKINDLERATVTENERRVANMHEVARNARISRAAIAAGMSVECWQHACQGQRRDPTLFPEERLSRPRWKPRARK